MQTTTNNPPALSIAAQPGSKGFLLPCPKCGEAQATIDLTLSDLATLRCQDCDNTFDTDDVRAFIRRWSAVLKWIDAAPVLPAE